MKETEIKSRKLSAYHSLDNPYISPAIEEIKLLEMEVNKRIGELSEKTYYGRGDQDDDKEMLLLYRHKRCLSLTKEALYKIQQKINLAHNS